MDLVIRSKNVEIPEEARQYIERKLSKLDHYLPGIGMVKVEVSPEKKHSGYVMQVTMDSRGTFLRGEERANTINAATDAVVDVLSRQVDRFKAKLYGSQRRGKLPD